jgi:hypothetical protein
MDAPALPLTAAFALVAGRGDYTAPKSVCGDPEVRPEIRKNRRAVAEKNAVTEKGWIRRLRGKHAKGCHPAISRVS